MKASIKLFTNLLKDESGQDLIEYALVAGLIGLGAVVMMTGLSGAIGNAFNSISTKVTSSVS
jgi:pilus assembly protein Flp/PilA